MVAHHTMRRYKNSDETGDLSIEVANHSQGIFTLIPKNVTNVRKTPKLLF